MADKVSSTLSFVGFLPNDHHPAEKENVHLPLPLPSPPNRLIALLVIRRNEHVLLQVRQPPRYRELFPPSFLPSPSLSLSLTPVRLALSSHHHQDTAQDVYETEDVPELGSRRGNVRLASTRTTSPSPLSRAHSLLSFSFLLDSVRRRRLCLPLLSRSTFSFYPLPPSPYERRSQPGSDR